MNNDESRPVHRLYKDVSVWKGRKGVMRDLGKNVRVMRDVRICEKSLCEVLSRCPLWNPCIIVLIEA